MMQALLEEADRLGAHVAYAALPPPQRAVYIDDQDLILISDRLDIIQRRESLAHELGHRKYLDRCSTPEAETRAWRYAAKLLVQFTDYLQAELIDPHPIAIATKLRTTRRIIELYQQHYLQDDALAAPRNLFGELEEEDFFEDSFRHSLKTAPIMSCGLGKIA